MDYNILQMEKLGIADYYLALNKYITLFIDRNYPLLKEDMSAIVNGASTDNITKRNDAFRILKESMNNILLREVEENRAKLEKWNNGEYSHAISNAEQQQKIFEYVQLMLEDLWYYQNRDVQSNKGVSGRK